MNNHYKKLIKLSKFLRKIGLDQASSDVAELSDPSLDDIRSGDLSVSKDSKLARNKKLISEIQAKLVNVGIDLPKFGVDGLYGAETEAAVIKLQKLLSDKGLLTKNPDGVFDSETIKGLDNNKDTIKEEISKKKEISEESSQTSQSVSKVQNTSGETLYIGASQLNGALGAQLVGIFGSGTKLAKNGSTPSHWATSAWTSVSKEISKGPSKIVIVTGGNGAAGAQSLVDNIWNSLSENGLTDKTRVYWIGANPPGASGFDSAGKPVNLAEKAFSYLKTSGGFAEARERRAGYNSIIESAVNSKPGWIFIDPYNYMKLSDGTPGFMCKDCDGIHMPQSAAQDLVSKISA